MYAITLIRGDERLALHGPLADEVYASARAILDGSEQMKLELLLKGTFEQVESALEGLGRCLSDAAPGGRVYLAVELVSGAGEWRTRVLRGRLAYPQPYVAARAQGQQAATLLLEREPFWEGDLTALEATNDNGSSIPNGLNVFNCNDGAGASPNKRQNWVEFAAAAVTGDLPALINTSIKDLSADAVKWFWMGLSWRDPTDFTPILETGNAVGKVGVDDETCSGGHKVIVALPSGAETELFRWILPAAMINDTQGLPAHMIARFADVTGIEDIEFTLKIYQDSVLIWQGDGVTPTASPQMTLRDLGRLRLPPGLNNLAGGDSLDIVLFGEQSTGAPVDVVLDFLAFLPADGLRFISVGIDGIALNNVFTDDQHQNVMYTTQTGGSTGGCYAIGDFIYLKPGVKQRLYFLTHTITGNSAPVDFKIAVSFWYRPRRSAL